jgi:hypothetical protein
MRRANLGVQSASSGSTVSQVPTTSWVAFTGAQTITFDAPPSGAVLISACVNHTLETSSGSPTVGLFPALSTPSSGIIAAAAPVIITPPAAAVSPVTATATYVTTLTGLTGSKTLGLYVRYSAGTPLNYTLNSHTLAVIPT